MPFLDQLRRLFGKKAPSQTLQAPLEALQIDLNRFKALEQRSESMQIEEEPSEIGLQKESLQLGIAAGYTGRSLRSIESSLNRIESLMVTKDWFASQFEDRTPELIQLLKTYDDQDQKRFEILQNSINSIKGIASISPEPIKTQLTSQIQTMEAQLSLTPRMQDLLSIASQHKEISYDDLSKKLNLTVSSLRGLLSNMAERTSQIERFNKYGKGWIRFIGKEGSDSIENTQISGESYFRDKFIPLIEKEGFKVLKQSSQVSPDFIIEKDDKKIGVELKSGSDVPSLQKALGQLIFAKTFYNLEEIWLAIPLQAKPFPDDWLKTFKSNNIKVLVLENDMLTEL